MANKKSVYFIQLEYNKERDKEDFEQWFYNMLYNIMYNINLKNIDADIVVDMGKFYECRNVTICNK